MSEDRLRILQRSVAPLEALPDHAKLRVVPIAEDATDLPMLTTHKLVLEDRQILQGVRRTWTNDGHRQTLRFVNVMVSEAFDLAEKATDTTPEVPTETLFGLTRLALLQALSAILAGAIRGLQRLRRTTYLGNDQVCIDIENLESDVMLMRSRIDQHIEQRHTL